MLAVLDNAVEFKSSVVWLDSSTIKRSLSFEEVLWSF